MSAASILEALARIEHKLDVVLDAVNIGPMKAVGSPTHQCPLCKKTPEYQIDINNAVVLRKCGCSTGKIPLDLKAFAPLPPTTKKDEEDNGRTDQEDGSDSDRGGRNRRR